VAIYLEIHSGIGVGSHADAGIHWKNALEVLEVLPIDVVISDLSMPEMDGFQFLKRVRTRFPTPESLSFPETSTKISVARPVEGTWRLCSNSKN
jgi:CheY-like chemotaxis protein